MNEPSPGNSSSCKYKRNFEMNPLENPVILSRLFEISPVKDLARYRLVSKLWHQLSLASWRSSCKISFWGDVLYGDVKRFWDENPKYNSTSLDTFLNYIDDPINDCNLKPYRQFVVREWEIKSKEENIVRFWLSCGPTITALELNDCFFHSLEEFRNVLYKYIPNLKKLTLKDYKFRFRRNVVEEGETYKVPAFGEHLNLKCLDIDMDHEALPISWLELLSHYPNLETLKLYNADQEEALESMLGAIKKIRKHDKRKLVIKHLDILSASLYAQETVSPSVCQLLRVLQLPLESLTIDLGVETKDSIIHDILEIHSKTLKKLDAYRGPISTPYRNFPFGVKLEALEEINMSDRLCQDLAFLKFLPNLKKLNICDVVEDRPPVLPTELITRTDASEMGGMRLEKLTHLRVDYVITEDDVKNLTKWLPNVEYLRMPIDNEQFQIICENWTISLVDLNILGNELDDRGVTGLSMSRAIRCEPGKPPPPIPANITHLKNLRSFKMYNDDVLPTKLMENSARNGFLKMPNLQRLKIASQMGDEMRDLLYQKIPECQIVRLESDVGVDSWD